jgi:hypothetical protein
MSTYNYFAPPASEAIHVDHSIGHTYKTRGKERKGRLTMSELLPIGTQAPDFTLPAADGQMMTLSALAGRKHVVLVFYVGDNTPD